MSARVERLDVHSGLNGEVWVGGDDWTPAEARELARRLLAAADDAEESR